MLKRKESKKVYNVVFSDTDMGATIKITPGQPDVTIITCESGSVFGGTWGILGLKAFRVLIDAAVKELESKED